MSSLHSGAIDVSIVIGYPLASQWAAKPSNPYLMKPLYSISSCLLIASLLLFASCSTENDEQTTLESVQAEAAQNWEQAVELSKERWAQIKSFTAEEWKDTEKSIVELKDKVVKVSSQNQERVAELMSEVKELQKDAQAQLKAFGETSGDKADQAKEALEQKWEELQAKVNELREALTEE